jgi:hypothetical protein
MELVLGGNLPEFAMTSPTLPGVTRRWTRLRDYSDEVSNARIYGGIHECAATGGRKLCGSLKVDHSS